MKKLIIIPAYNEEDAIAHTVARIREKAPDFDYVIINDCSTDRTLAICRENGFHVVNLPINLGIGGAVQTGYKFAYANGYDIALVQRLLQHSSAAVTQRYIGIGPKRIEAAIETHVQLL